MIKAFTRLCIFTFIFTCSCDNANKFAGAASKDAVAYNQKNFTQKSLSSFTQSLIQGAADSESTETFKQGQAFGLLDLLIVIDDSGSMGEEQGNLSTKLQPLISEIKDSNWQIGITTTSKDRDCYALISKQDADYAAKFKTAVEEAGVTGDGTEIGLYQAVEGLKGQCAGIDWLRNESAVSVLIVSDEDNCSSDNTDISCQGTNSFDKSYLLNHLNSIRSLGNDARIYGLISDPSDTCVPEALGDGTIYKDAILSSKGTFGKICDPSYAKTLKNISKDLAAVLRSKFKLKAAAAADSVRILVDGVEVPASEFSVSKKSISFKEPPTNGAKVEIYYRALEASLKTTFKLDQAATNDGTSVYIDGKEIDKKEYFIDETNQTIVFDFIPPLNSEIVFDFAASDTVLQKQFEIPAALDESKIYVQVNGNRVSNYSYDSEKGWIIFEEAPAVDSEIVVNFSKNP